jgi:hypothetical protein
VYNAQRPLVKEVFIEGAPPPPAEPVYPAGHRNRNQGLDSLPVIVSQMIQSAETAGLSYRVLLVDGEPNWLK